MSIIIENVKNKRSVVDFLAEKNPGRAKPVLSAFAALLIGDGVSDVEREKLEAEKEKIKTEQAELQEKIAKLIADKKAIQAQLNGLEGSGVVEVPEGLQSYAEKNGIVLS